MTDAELTADATGETVGEAKWAALRELERRHPGLDKGAVQFEVVSEGERGILGVGYEPARVVAHLPAEAAEAAEAAQEAGDQAADARGLVARIVSTLGVDADVGAREEAEAIVVTCSGPDVGLLAHVRRGPAGGRRRRRRLPRPQAGDAGVARAAGRRPRARVGRARGARADDGGRAQGRPPAAEGRLGSRDDLRGHGAEPLRRRRS
jgi:hypothetical protein